MALIKTPWYKSRWFIGSAVVLGLLLAAGLWWLAQPKAVEVITLKPRDAQIWLALSGRVVADESTEIASPITGRVVAVYVEEGDTVSQGQQLAQLESDAYQAQVSEAQARLEQQRALLQQTLEGERVERRQEIAAQVNEAKRNLASTRQQLAANAAEAKRAQAKLNRYQTLRESDVISALEWEAIQAEAKQAIANKEALQQQVEAQQQRVSQLQSVQESVKQGARATEIQSQRALVQAQAAQLAALKQRQSDYVLRAPFSGVVSERLVDAGSVLQPGNAVLTLVNPAKLRVEADLEEEDLSRLPKHPEAWVHLEAYPEQLLPARLQRVQPKVEADSGILHIQLSVELPKQASVSLLPGLTADAYLLSKRLTKSLIVPKSSVIPVKDSPSVITLPANHSPTPVAVETETLSRQLLKITQSAKPLNNVAVILSPDKETLAAKKLTPQPSQLDPLASLAQPPDPNTTRQESRRPSSAGQSGG